MEEQAGIYWHRFITRMADRGHAGAGVDLTDVEKGLGLFFRALGGDPGLQITVAEASRHGARRGWLQRIAGSGREAQLAWRDGNYLRLPPRVELFTDPGLNRDLYFWLAALAAMPDIPVESRGEVRDGDWFTRQQGLTLACLDRFPGLTSRYRRLALAHLQQRPDPASLPKGEAAAERAIVRAIDEPGSVPMLPPSRRPAQPVPLWLHPNPPTAPLDRETTDPDDAASGGASRKADQLRRRAQRVDSPKENRGLITIRMENIFSWGEFVNVDRSTDDEDDPERAEQVARDLDTLAVSRGGKPTATRLRFDLDLPPAESDDAVDGPGEMQAEWDWRKRRLIADHCRVLPLVADEASPRALPEHLHATAARLRRQFQALAPARIWFRGQGGGDEIDLDAYQQFEAARRGGLTAAPDRLYRQMRSGARDLACLLMADLSLSTDTYINDTHRVIDVVRDSLYLFGESLHATGDQFALYGFSSRKRDPVRVHRLKAFEEAYGDRVRGRIEAVKPGYYTRLGAAIRFATKRLSARPAGRRLLLVVTDGKPNDIDQYEGRYGIEDTRQAIIEARRLGLQPFCVTIDDEANDYLPHLFGSGGFVVIRDPRELPARLPLLYARLTQ